jgi:hypothetical protein
LLTTALVASGGPLSTVEEFIPALQQPLVGPLDPFSNAIDFFSLETAASLQSYGIEPERRDALVSFDMNVRRFPAITCVEEEPKRPDSRGLESKHHGRHTLMLRMLAPGSNADFKAVAQRSRGVLAA